MRRAVSYTELKNIKRSLVTLPEPWGSAIGRPELRGVWFVYGGSRNGKSTLTAMIAKMLTGFGRVVFDSLEEGLSTTLKLNLDRVKIQEVSSRILFLDKEPISELKARLDRSRNIRCVVIDSAQYMRCSFSEFEEIANKYNVLFIVTSGIKSGEPRGRLAMDIYYHADVKIYVQGFKAFITSRYGGKGEIVIWEEGADEYWSAGVLKHKNL